MRLWSGRSLGLQAFTVSTVGLGLGFRVYGLGLRV